MNFNFAAKQALRSAPSWGDTRQSVIDPGNVWFRMVSRPASERPRRPFRFRPQESAIHTLGQRHALAPARSQVGLSPVGRHSRPNVGNVAVGSRSHGRQRTATVCQQRTLASAPTRIGEPPSKFAEPTRRNLPSPFRRYRRTMVMSSSSPESRRTRSSMASPD